MANKKILIVEDDSSISAMYKTKFSQQNFDVLVAEDGAQGLEAAAKENPDIILLDVILPQLDGFSVLGEIKANKKINKVPVIMLTNLGTEEDKQKAKDLGAADYIVKANLTPKQVEEIVSKYLK